MPRPSELRNSRHTWRTGARTLAFHSFAVVLAALFLAPLVLTMANSIKSPTEANQQPPTLIPHSFSLHNYARLAEYGEGIGTYVRNSIALSLATVIGTVVVCALAGHAFARFRFPGRNVLFVATLAILMVPYATLLLPLYLVLSHIGLANSIVGLALVLVVFQLPFGIFIMRNSFEAIPREIEEAALVDGAGALKSLRLVSLPLVAPALATVALFSFIASWNEFLAPLIFLNSNDNYTLPIMLVSVQSNGFGDIDFGAMQAGVVISFIPPLIFYLLLQRFYVAGLVSGAVRG
jgi:multiple sugar transport system permease protein